MAELGLEPRESGSRAGVFKRYQGVCVLLGGGGERGSAIKMPGIEGCLRGLRFGFGLA